MPFVTVGFVAVNETQVVLDSSRKLSGCSGTTKKVMVQYKHRLISTIVP